LNIKSKIRDWLFADSIQTKSDRTGRVNVYMFGGSTVPQIDDNKALEKAKEVDPFVGISVDKITNAISGLPFDVYRKYEKDGEIEYQKEDNHPAAALIDSPNPRNTKREMLSHISQSFMTTGNSFLTLEPESASAPQEIWFKKTDLMECIIDKNTGELVGYLYGKGTGFQKEYLPEEVVHIRNYDCTRPYYGASPLLCIEQQILLNYYGRELNKDILKNKAIPVALALMEEGYELNEADRKRLQDSWEKEHKKKGNRGKLGFTPPGIKDIKEMQWPIKDLLYIESTRLIREIIFAAMGLPPFVGGVMEYANYANSLPQMKAFWQDTIVPKCRIIESNMNRQLLWPRYTKGCNDLVFRFDLSGVSALQEDEKAKAEMYSTLVGKKPIFKVNEARAQGWQLDEVEGGDDIKAQARNPFETQEGAEKSIGEKTPLPKDGKAPSKSFRSERWKSFDKRLSVEEKSFEKIIYKYFRDQESRIIDALDIYTVGGKMMSKLSELSKDETAPKDINQLFDLDAEKAAMAAATAPAIKDALRRAAEAAYNEYGFDLVFNLRNPDVVMMIDEFKSALDSVNDVNYEQIRGILSEGYQRGASIGDITKEIRAEYKHMREFRPARIARTEMTGVVNGGSFAGYKQAGIGKKEWLASLDANTRDTHAMADGEVVPINKPFTRTGWPIQYPGDPNAPAGEIVNCRCTIMPVVDD